MEVSIPRYDPKEAAILVNAVVDAYLTEVVRSRAGPKASAAQQAGDRVCGQRTGNPQHAARTEEPGGDQRNFGGVGDDYPEAKADTRRLRPLPSGVGEEAI